MADTRGGGAKGDASPTPIIFTEALVLKSGSTRKFSFQEEEHYLLFSITYIDIEYNQIAHLGLVLKSNFALVFSGESMAPTFHYSLCPSFCLRRTGLTGKGIINFYILILYFSEKCLFCIFT